jgi:hypothetical protein
MNATFTNVTVLGQLNFNDGSILSSTDDLKFINVSGFERNLVNGTTSLLADKFLLNNDLICPTKILSNNIQSNSIVFNSDVDQNGDLNIQTNAFTSSLKSDIESTTTGFNSLLTDHFDRPNKRMRVTDGTNSSTYGANFVTINSTTYSDTSINIPPGTFDITKGAGLPRIQYTNDSILMYVGSGAEPALSISTSGIIIVDPTNYTLHKGNITIQGALNMTSPGQINNPTFGGTVVFSASTVTGLTKSNVGLQNVDNTSDLNKPVSTAQQTALNLKANLASPTFTGTVSGITKSMVGLSDVDNTSDTAKPVSTAQQTALNLKANLASPTFTGTVSVSKLNVNTTQLDPVGVLNTSTGAGYFLGIATSSGQLNPMVALNDSMVIAKGTTAGSSELNGVGVGKILMATWGNFRNGMKITANESKVGDNWSDNGNKIEIECGSAKYLQNKDGFSVNKNLSVTGDLSVSGVISGSFTGLSNVDNTSDLDKPVSTATQTALDLKANLASPTFTGTVAGITKSMVGLSNVDNTSDTSKPISTATQTALNLKANSANPTFTGTLSADSLSTSTIYSSSLDIKRSSATPDNELEIVIDGSQTTTVRARCPSSNSFLKFHTVNGTTDYEVFNINPARILLRRPMEISYLTSPSSSDHVGFCNGTATSSGIAMVSVTTATNLFDVGWSNGGTYIIDCKLSLTGSGNHVLTTCNMSFNKVSLTIATFDPAVQYFTQSIINRPGLTVSTTPTFLDIRFTYTKASASESLFFNYITTWTGGGTITAKYQLNYTRIG